ncbi:hypothetical protein [Parapedobacter sp. 2B3]|uniref:hypothetical protein n=1 Tax=Parapedobacter sp. 2B3 TaxID=3342381 RepID=UPI0035B69718
MERTKTILPKPQLTVLFYRVLESTTRMGKDHSADECAAYGGEFLDDGLRMVEQPMKQNQFKFYAHTQGF